MNPRVSARRRSRRRPPGSRSPRSPPSSPSATRSTRSRTTSPRETPASFEPSSTTWSPRSRAGRSRSSPAPNGRCSGTQMQSVGEVMAIGRTFPESLQKGLRSLELGRFGLNAIPPRPSSTACPSRRGRCSRAAVRPPDRLFAARPSCCGAARPSTSCTRRPRSIPWFLDQMLMIVEERSALAEVTADHDGRLAAPGQAPGLQPTLSSRTSGESTRPRSAPAADRARVCVRPSRRSTPARAEFEPTTPYHYSTYEDTERGRRERPGEGDHPRFGAEPHRPGHRVRLLLRARQLRAARRRLRDHHGQLQPVSPGIIVSLGGQTPLKLAGLLPAGAHRRDLALTRSTSPRIASAGTRSAPNSRSRSHPVAPRSPPMRRSRSCPASGSLRWCGPRTCSAAAP